MSRCLLRMTVLLAALGLLGGCGSSGPPPAPTITPATNVETEPSPDWPTEPLPQKEVEGPSLANAQADFQLTAEELHQAFQQDKQAAAQKYRGKILEVKGTVERVGRVMYPPSIVSYQLKAGGRLDLGVMVNVEGDDALIKAQPGQEVVFRGAWVDNNHLPFLGRGWIVSATGEACPKFTTAELKQQVLADPAAFKQKYEGRYIQVSGIVGFIGKPELGSAIMLKDGPTLISLNLVMQEDHGTLKGLQPGQPFAVLIQVSPYQELSEAKIHLREGLILTAKP